MKQTEYSKAIKEQCEYSIELLDSKSQEYAENNEDRLIHFKKAASLMGTNQKQAIFSMLSKHIISISEMIASGETYTLDRWTEKISDAINYLLILKAAVVEELD